MFHDAVAEEGMIKDSEVSDITNAILQGVTGFILRDCTNVKATVRALTLMEKVCLSVEPTTASITEFWRMADEVQTLQVLCVCVPQKQNY